MEQVIDHIFLEVEYIAIGQLSIFGLKLGEYHTETFKKIF